MKQRSFDSQPVLEKYGRRSLREVFLDEMQRIVPGGSSSSSLRRGWAWSSARGPFAYVEDVLRAAVVQPAGPRGGGVVV